MLRELASRLAHAIDPVAFAEACGVTPDQWQADLLRSSSRRALLLCSRQSGKSTVTAIIALWTAIFEAGQVVIVSPSQRQSGEMIRTIQGFLAHLEDGPKVVGESVLKLEFENGARIMAFPGTERTVRGIAGVSLVIIDEAARVDDELLAAVRPMLATNGRLIALSTPAGRRGFFFEAWTNGEGWHRVRVAADQCPRISKEFLADELKALGPTRFSEEYDLTFLDDQSSAFSSAIIAAAFTTDFPPFFPEGL